MDQQPRQEELLESGRMALSVIIPTYNESQNIVAMLDSVSKVLPGDDPAEIIVIDDNSPDGTGDIASRHAQSLRSSRLSVEIIRRPAKMGLSSAILAGIHSASGEIVVVMDSDLSHPPQTIPGMVRELKGDDKCDIVVASRYVKGGYVAGWPFKRKLISKGATKIAQYGLKIRVKDPMSGFFAFKRRIIEGIKFDPLGYKMLLEMLVKTRGARVKEVPYTFTNRRAGSSKLDSSVMLDYIRAVWRLYRYGSRKAEGSGERRTSVRFLSKAGRFYTVGASGLLVNYMASLFFRNMFSDQGFLYATVIGILFSITSNFFLNKVWTFEDRNFALKKTASQYGLFLGFSSLGALLQLSLIYTLVERYGMSYEPALVLAVAVASVGNFLFNKKWTFRERIWS